MLPLCLCWFCMGVCTGWACRCPSKGGTVFPKVALLTTIVAPVVTLHAWAGAPQMRALTYVTLHSTLLRREAPRPLRLMVGSIIRSPPLLMSQLGPRWSTNPVWLMWLLWALTFYFTLHLLHHSSLLY